MTDPQTLLDLAERCERATGPDRELDRLIYETAILESEVKRRGASSWFCAMDGSSYGFNFDDAPTGKKVAWWGELPRCTGSTAAAMMLVPKGALWRVSHLMNFGTVLFERPRGEPEKVFSAGVGIGDVPAEWTGGRSFASAALALCAASLRALAAIRKAKP